MFKPLNDASDDFANARDDYQEASKEQNAEAAIDALVRGMQAADAVLSFLGFVEPYECGDCESCKANGDARRSEMEAAVENDPSLSVRNNGPLLDPAADAESRRLLLSVFGDPAGDEDAEAGNAPE